MIPSRRPGPGRALVLLRHGQSTANAADEFTGWLDAPLTSRGEDEAHSSGALLVSHQLLPDVVHTSLLTRSIRTAELLLTELGRGAPSAISRTAEGHDRLGPAPIAAGVAFCRSESARRCGLEKSARFAGAESRGAGGW